MGQRRRTLRVRVISHSDNGAAIVDIDAQCLRHDWDLGLRVLPCNHWEK